MIKNLVLLFTVITIALNLSICQSNAEVNEDELIESEIGIEYRISPVINQNSTGLGVRVNF